VLFLSCDVFSILDVVAPMSKLNFGGYGCRNCHRNVKYRWRYWGDPRHPLSVSAVKFSRFPWHEDQVLDEHFSGQFAYADLSQNASVMAAADDHLGQEVARPLPFSGHRM
jgi:hypothetical protein